MLAGVLGKSKTDSMLNEYAALVGDAVLRQRARLAEHKARIEIELAKRVKSEFLANMSHELRTPLNTVIGFSKLLSDHGKQKLTDAQVVQYAELIRDAGDHLLSVINDILDITKMQSGAYALESNEVDLIDVLHSCTESVRAAADIAGITLRENIAFNLPPVRGDDAKLAQVFKNLLNNAIKFTQTGEVVLSARKTAATEKTVTIRFEVRDSGIGIAPELQPHLFQAFSQADASTTRRYGGTGLGLAISRWIVELMGGRIGVSSSEGKGATFWFEIPFELGEGAAMDKIASADLAALRVLVVDDNATNREILKRRLEAWGMRGFSEADGAGALAEVGRAAAAGQAYGLALIDMQMPGMDGLELVRAIHAQPALSGLPLILMTSVDRAGLSQEARHEGVESCLTKPVRQSSLFDAIVNAVSKKTPGSGEGAASGVATAAAKNGRILIAEDNRVNQRVAAFILKKLGYESDVVNNGVEALRALESKPYALILMDSHMPEMDGFAATAAIRGKGGKLKDIPIIAVTADALTGDREKCIQAGMSDYLSKPVSLEAVRRVLSHWLHEDTDA